MQGTWNKRWHLLLRNSSLEKVEIQTVKQINQHNAALFGCGTLEHCIPSLKLSFLTNQTGLIISYLLFHLLQLPTFCGSLPVSEIHQMLKLPSLCLTIPAALSVWGAPFRCLINTNSTPAPIIVEDEYIFAQWVNPSRSSFSLSPCPPPPLLSSASSFPLPPPSSLSLSQTWFPQAEQLFACLPIKMQTSYVQMLWMTQNISG